MARVLLQIFCWTPLCGGRRRVGPLNALRLSLSGRMAGRVASRSVKEGRRGPLLCLSAAASSASVRPLLTRQMPLSALAVLHGLGMHSSGDIGTSSHQSSSSSPYDCSHSRKRQTKSDRIDGCISLFLCPSISISSSSRGGNMTPRQRVAGRPLPRGS